MVTCAVHVLHNHLHHEPFVGGQMTIFMTLYNNSIPYNKLETNIEYMTRHDITELTQSSPHGLHNVYYIGATCLYQSQPILMEDIDNNPAVVFVL